jgi:hypothetical protein
MDMASATYWKSTSSSPFPNATRSALRLKNVESPIVQIPPLHLLVIDLQAGPLLVSDPANLLYGERIPIDWQRGKTWEVRSDTVSLAEHVGHTVSATGVVANSTAHNLKEDAKDMSHDIGVKKNIAEHGHMKITDLQMVSHSCPQ